MDVLITNNPLVEAKYTGKIPVEYIKGSMYELMIVVRDRVHGGCRLITHPMSGSVKPGETPFKSVLISDSPGFPGSPDQPDLGSLLMIEECLLSLSKFARNPIRECDLHDMQTVDLALIRPAIEKHLNVT